MDIKIDFFVLAYGKYGLKVIFKITSNKCNFENM